MTPARHDARPLSLELKAATDAAHRQAERLIERRAPVDERAGYRRFLDGMRALHAAHAEALDQASAIAGLAPRTEALLTALAADGAAAPRAPVRPAAPDLDCLGVGYVFEGSALGAALLLRRPPAGPTAYLSLLAAEGGGRWRRYKAALDRAPVDRRRTIDAALRSFDAVREEFRDERP